MNINRINDDFSTAAQLNPADLDEIAAGGFTTVINNRPDNEGEDQPSSDSLAQRAAELDLDYVHIPVKPDAIESSHIEAFQQALGEAKGPVLAFCRTGKRAATLWALARRGTCSADEILNQCFDAGFDLEPLRPRLAG